MVSYNRRAVEYRAPCRGRSDRQWDNVFSDNKKAASLAPEQELISDNPKTVASIRSAPERLTKPQ
jgi:hypothetical protein